MNQILVRRMSMALGLWRLLRYQSHICRWLPLTIAPPKVDAARWLGNIRLGGRAHHALFVAPEHHATYRFVAPPRCRVVAWCGLASAGLADTHMIEFVATVQSNRSSRELTKRLRMNVGRTSRARRWRKLVLDLQNRNAQEFELTLTIHMDSKSQAVNPSAFWGEPRLEWRRPRGEVHAALRATRRLAYRGSLIAAARTLHGYLSERSDPSLYQLWLREHSLSPARIAEMQEGSASLGYRPLVSVVTPVYNTDARWLRGCIESVKQQAYPNWQLCLVDDGSTKAETRTVLREYEADPRIKIKRMARNNGIAAASNEALTLAEGEFVAFLDHDDELTPDALFEMVAHLNQHEDADFIYSDEDKVDLDRTRSDVYFKPDWSPEHFLTNMYTGHLMVVRRALLQRVGGFRVGYDGAQDYDLVLRLIEQTSRIHHVAKVLYHWRRTPESSAGREGAKPWAHDAGRLALEDYVRRHKLKADVLPGALKYMYRVRYGIQGEPLISIVLPALPDVAHLDGDSKRACERTLAMLAERTSYRRLEVILPAERGRTSHPALQIARSLTIREVLIEGPSIRGRLRHQKRAAAQAGGTHLLFLDWGLRSSDNDWLTALLEYSQQPAIGAVGAKLHYPDGSLEHIGIVLGVNGVAAPAFHLHPRSSWGYWGTAIAVRNYSAVSGTCLMTRRDVYDELCGFDDEMGALADVDYCLRARRAGYRIVFTPHASLVRDNPSSSSHDADPDDSSRFRMRWSDTLARDPYYNPNFSRDTPDYELNLISNTLTNG
jgi:glycosyltransferase involved in cell wall biosynthesis